MMDWYDGDVGWTAWLTMTAMMLVFWGLVVVVVIVVARSLGSDRGERSDPSAPRDPLQILDERLARGEIDEAEYRERREVLRHRGREPR